MQAAGTGGCSFCGGLGHSIVDCPKIEKDSKRLQRGHYDALQMGRDGDWYLNDTYSRRLQI